jgi:pyruvate dehydrogenase E2 component (dihydrolipoyllysine-residue acetyltransferase)
MIEKIVVPDIGENVVSGKVVAVHIQAGDNVAVDDTLIELETDKAVVEIPSTAAGRVTEVLAAEGDELKVGDAIAGVDTQARGVGPAVKAPAPGPSAARGESVKKGPPVKEEIAPEKKAALAKVDLPEVEAPPAAGSPGVAAETEEEPVLPIAAGALVPASPGIRRLARELGADIHKVQGSGPGGRITEADVKAYVRKTLAGGQAVAAGMPAGAGEPPLPNFSRWGAVETVELESVRRLTAVHTAASWRIIPHVTQFDKADITVLEDFLKKNSVKVAQAGGKLTLTPVLAKVCAQALIKYPRFNTSLDANNGRLIQKHYVHIGIAVDTPRGLLVPVIRNADTKSITDLAVEIADLAARARTKKVTAAEMEGGSFTISNQGGIGGVGFTPIILWPQVAILGVSRTATEPVAVEGQFQPRRMLPLSLSYDHRVIDGADAARFLRWVCACLEQPMTLLL